MNALDTYIPTPERAEDKPFLMCIEDVFSIKGRGTVGTGRIERGKVQGRRRSRDRRPDEGSRARRSSPASRCSTRRWTTAWPATTSACCCAASSATDLERGQVLAKPGSITPHTKFEASVYVLSKEEGGRHTPFFTGYRPQFYFRTTDVTGTVHAARRRRDVHARRQRQDDGRADRRFADRHGRRPALRHPRGRPHRRLRRRDQDSGSKRAVASRER